ncbi:MAG TPA: lysine biosynthesis protein LysX [Firmicutes bacterium]|nr:lysine biosynthesis protein LysX [Bacillota bacterium]
MRLAVVLSRLRQEERLIFEALAERGIACDRLLDSEIVFDLTRLEKQYDSVLIRSISQLRGQVCARVLDASGTLTLNSPSTIAICNDKILTTLALVKAGLPSPRTLVALDESSALDAVSRVGYPAVLKPTTGSWGRLLARINDRDAAEAVIEHKARLGSYLHSVFYVQEHIAKPGRDIRVVVVGGHAIAAMYRVSDHWVTNAARGGRGINYPLSGEAAALAERAALAVGGGVLAVDLLEAPDGLLVNEVNATMEFKECTEASGVDIAGALVDYWLEVARSGRSHL